MKASTMPNIGDMVWFTLEEGRKAGEVRPAVVIEATHQDNPFTVNLRVFTGPFDSIAETLSKFAVQFDPVGQKQGTWRWPQ